MRFMSNEPCKANNTAGTADSHWDAPQRVPYPCRHIISFSAAFTEASDMESRRAKQIGGIFAHARSSDTHALPAATAVARRPSPRLHLRANTSLRVTTTR